VAGRLGCALDDVIKAQKNNEWNIGRNTTLSASTWNGTCA
jgi:hypothetical protein